MSCSLKKYVANLLYRTKELENKLSGLSSLDYIVLDPQENLPTPSEETIGKIYLLLPDPNVETRYEYITIKKDDETYEWEKLGSTDIDLTGYLNEDNFISSFDNTLQDTTHRMVSDTEKDNWNNNSVHLSELNLTVEQKRTARSNIEAASISLLSNLTETLDAIAHDYSKDYLTFTALESGTFTFSQNALQYSLDDGATWTTLAANTASPTVTAGDKILWKQTGLTPTSSDGIGTFSATGNFAVSGNIMSLLYGDNFIRQKDLTGKDFAYGLLFFGNNNLVSAENLILPATTLAYSCYANMFQNCTKLTTAPELPATTLSNYCYYNMFQNCTSLTTVPQLPATILSNGCYSNIFEGCTSLTIAPILPATTLANGCYQNMFYGCTKLTVAPELPVTTLTNNCYSYMFYLCKSLTTAPELPATTLANYCYNSMFNGCTNLKYIKCLAIDISATSCTLNWVSNVAASGTFVKADNMTAWTSGNNGIPSGWTVYTKSEYELVRHYELPTLATDSDVRDIVTEYNN